MLFRKKLLVALRIIWDTWILSVGKIQEFLLLKQLVHAVIITV
jgi:hypothetical protein